MKIACLAGALCAASFVAAYPETHGPFEPGKGPPLFALKNCVRTEIAPPADTPALKIASFSTAADGQGVCVRNEVDTSSYVQRFTVCRDGAVLVGPIAYPAGLFSPHPVQWADLNKDGQPDFIATMWWGGCGLAAGNCMLVFVVSHKKTYTVTAVETMFPGDHAFVDFDRDGVCEFIHTSFSYGPVGKDGKQHNYWIYNALGIRDGKVVLMNAKDRRFPMWIWYTFKENHKPTTQLTEAQKRAAWEQTCKERPMFTAPNPPVEEKKPQSPPTPGAQAAGK